MNKVEKQVFGTAMVDGNPRQDVLKTTVSFTNHKILQPRESEAQVRDALERFLFERAVEYMNRYMARLGPGGADGSGPCHESATSAKGEPVNLKDPEVYLQHLIKALDSHQELLRLEANTIRVNRVGEMVAAGSQQVANNLELLEIHLGHHANEVLTLVRYSRQEMLSQDELLRRAIGRL